MIMLIRADTFDHRPSEATCVTPACLRVNLLKVRYYHDGLREVSAQET